MICPLDLVRLTNAELARHGLPREVVTFERMRTTGHERRIAPQWIPSIGMWGGTRSVKDIADALDMPRAQVRSWMKFRRLRTRTRRYERTPAQLAVLSLATTGPAREVAPRLGILAAECCAYRAAGQRIRDAYDVTLATILSWPPDKLERAWEDQGLDISYSERPFNPSNPDDISVAIDAAQRRMREPTEVERALATIRRELPELHLDSSPASTLRPEFLADLDDIIAESERRLGLEEASR